MVERAKGLIIEQYGVTEQQAYSLLRRWSMATRKPLRAVAEVVLERDQTARLIKVLKQHPGKDIWELREQKVGPEIGPTSYEAVRSAPVATS